ncbi:phage portal protein family protein [Methylocystis sp. S23]
MKTSKPSSKAKALVEGKAKAPPSGLIASAAVDITIPRYTKVLRPSDETLLHNGGGKGIALYREVLRDGRAYSVLQKRKRGLVKREFVVKPASEARIDKKAAQICERQLKALDLNAATLGLLDATLMGFAVGEVVWERDAGEIVARKFPTHDQRRFVFGPEGDPRLLTWENMAWGEELPDRKFIVHRFERLSSDPYGWGLGRILFWHVLFKREGVAFWMKALERFATPLPVAKYPMGSLPDQQRILLESLVGALVEGALVVPAGTEIDFATAAVSGTLTHESWCRYWDEQTAETVLGETLSTNIGSSGSKAAASTHKEVSDELIDGDAELLGKTLQETLLSWITLYNVPDAQPPLVTWPRPREIAEEEEAFSKRADRRKRDLSNLAQMKAMGWAPADEQALVEEIMDTEVVAVAPAPAPGDDAEVPPPPTGTTSSFAEGEPDVEEQAALLEEQTAPMIGGWFDAIQAAIGELLAQGKDLADLPEALEALFPALDEKKLARALGAAFSGTRKQARADLQAQIK